MICSKQRQTDPEPMTQVENHPIIAAIAGAAVVDAIKHSGVEFVVSVPDRVTSETVLRRVAADAALKLVPGVHRSQSRSRCELSAGLGLHARRGLARKIQDGAAATAAGLSGNP